MCDATGLPHGPENALQLGKTRAAALALQLGNLSMFYAGLHNFRLATKGELAIQFVTCDTFATALCSWLYISKKRETPHKHDGHLR